MELFFTALLLGLFALVPAELTGRLLGFGVSFVRPDLDPEDVATNIQYVLIPSITICGAAFLTESVDAFVLLAGGAATVGFIIMKWLARPAAVQVTPPSRRRF
jgi:hypothetical protein